VNFLVWVVGSFSLGCLVATAWIGATVRRDRDLARRSFLAARMSLMAARHLTDRVKRKCREAQEETAIVVERQVRRRLEPQWKAVQNALIDLQADVMSFKVHSAEVDDAFIERRVLDEPAIYTLKEGFHG
jgi:uncharacterized protein (DUF3084 family)